MIKRIKNSIRRIRGVEIIVYGQHSEDWNQALAAEAEVWNLIPSVRQVRILKANQEVDYGEKSRYRTVIIPMLEEHILNCPEIHYALLPDKVSLQTLSNKALFAEYVKSHGLEKFCPQIYADKKQAKYPCIIKRTDLNAGAGVEVVLSEEHLEELLLQEIFNTNPYILQQYIAGRDYVTHAVCKNGKILWHHSYEYENLGRQIRRNSLSANSIGMPRSHIKRLEQFLKPLSFTGPCNFDYKFSVDGTLQVMEINPRLGGSLMYPKRVQQLKSAINCLIKHAVVQK